MIDRYCGVPQAWYIDLRPADDDTGDTWSLV
jgi:hypothetical protein